MNDAPPVVQPPAGSDTPGQQAPGVQPPVVPAPAVQEPGVDPNKKPEDAKQPEPQVDWKAKYEELQADRELWKELFAAKGQAASTPEEKKELENLRAWKAEIDKHVGDFQAQQLAEQFKDILDAPDAVCDAWVDLVEKGMPEKDAAEFIRFKYKLGTQAPAIQPQQPPTPPAHLAGARSAAPGDRPVTHSSRPMHRSIEDLLMESAQVGIAGSKKSG